jgi:hypothetical protein
LAASLGFNTVRVFLHDLLWNQDAEGFLKRIDKFLAIADKYSIKTMLVLFDAVWDPFPTLGTQREPRLNVHNSGWVQSPGFKILNDVAKHDTLQGYVRGVVNRFKHDERVLIWDLFNEPDNINAGSYNDNDYVMHKSELSLRLLKKAVGWIRAIDPIQPLTSAPWQWTDTSNLSSIDNFMFKQMDVISFHCYENKNGLEKRILELKQFGRPMFCTEYMARTLQSSFKEVLPLLKKHSVGAYSWGLVAGKSQTHCSWDSWIHNTGQEPEIWFHDIFRVNGEPYDREEINFIKKVTKKKFDDNIEYLEIA